MKDDIKDKLLQVVFLTKEGIYGEKAKNELNKVQNIPSTISYLIDLINDLYISPEKDKELYQIGKSINEYLLILYRDTKVKNKEFAKALFESLFSDFPNTNNTNLFDRYRTLIESSVAFKSSISIDDRLILWNVAIKLFEAYNEFLNGLLGYIIICAVSVLENKCSIEFLNNSYQSKIDKFNSLKLNYLFPVISNIAKPEIRNAISHSRIQLIKDNGVIDYTIKKEKIFINKTIDLSEFIGMVSAGTYLPIGYITAISSIYVIEYGNITDICLLPEEIKSIFKIKEQLHNN